MLNVYWKELFKILITTTATLRPQILNQTLQSFVQNLLVSTESDHLIINIDNVGEPNTLPGDVINTAKKYFNKVTYNIGGQNFAQAFKWCWKTAIQKACPTDPYILHLEDDWLLLRYLDLYDMFQIMDSDPTLAILRLPFTDAGATHCKQWNKTFPYNGRYFECPRELKANLGFSGHPSLIRASFIFSILGLLHTNSCPEKQIKGHNLKMKRELEKWKFGVYSKPNMPKAIMDIGRSWREERGFKKGNTRSFTRWEK